MAGRLDIDDDRQELAGEDQVGHADPNRNHCTGAATHGFGDEDFFELVERPRVGLQVAVLVDLSLIHI